METFIYCINIDSIWSKRPKNKMENTNKTDGKTSTDNCIVVKEGQKNKPLNLSYRQTKELIKFLSREIFDLSDSKEMQNILQTLKNNAENHEEIYGIKDSGALGCGLFDKDNPDFMRSCGDILFNNKIWLCRDCRYKDYTLEQLKIIDNSLQIVERRM